MKSIRNRVLILFTFCLCSIVTFSTLVFISFLHLNKLTSDNEKSYEIIENVLALQNKQLSNENLKALNVTSVNLTPAFRSEALKNVLEKQNSSTINFLMRTEGEFHRHNIPLIEYFRNRTKYFGAITLAIIIFFIFSIGFIVFNQVFSPLKDLSSKMNDFIHNRYSYKFTVPELNEIGSLHSQFNSMAQKVLSQINDLKSLDKAKSEFLSIASHELRTPLTSIKGSLSLLKSGVTGKTDVAPANLMTIALDETDRLIRLINELLDLAKIEARQFPLNCEWVWAKDLVEKTFSGLQGLCQSANIKLSATENSDLDLYVDADRAQQILTNLISNAIKFSPAGKTIEVRFVLNDQNQIRTEITDYGHGIAPEDQEIIFEKFRQSTNPLNPLIMGTGLGLAIAKALVEQHNGQIGVHSVPGEGSTFYFTLPRWRHHDELNKEAA
ncbi:MAG: hypothetical protein A2Z20_04665 [Bdellovibrionales bacterium RBG_16_40_8]|nr:MAG: hypothetical protein A2Z20_04665 [Bdellovibrionales bacterium RBG_16_40_8]